MQREGYLSPSMEHQLQREERISAVRNASRTRLRKVECCLPDCTASVYRSNLFPLCIDHLLRVWRLVDDMPQPSPWAMPASMELIPKAVDTAHVVTEEELEAKRLASRQRQREIATTNGTLYVLDTGNDTVKIGWTKRDLWQRLNEYPPHFRLIVSVPGTKADERDVHRSLKLFRAAAQEWYFVKPEVVRQINTWIALANTINAQAATQNRINYGYANPDLTFEPTLLPMFTSLAEWRGNLRPPQVSMPAPKSRSGGWRVG